MLHKKYEPFSDGFALWGYVFHLNFNILLINIYIDSDWGGESEIHLGLEIVLGKGVYV